MKSLFWALLLIVPLAGCKDEQRAQELGLLPKPVMETAQVTLPPDNPLNQLQLALLHKEDVSLKLPPVASMESMTALQTGNPTVKDIWEAAQIDATDMATLTASLNQITRALPKDLSDLFDASAKTVLYQVTLDPEIIKKAGANQVPTNADLQTAAQHVLHGKTPAQVVSMAYEEVKEMDRARMHDGAVKTPALLPGDVPEMPAPNPAPDPAP